MVLVDTPIWSLALRRTHTDLNPRERLLTGALRDLVRDGVAGIIGPIRQEVLSGIRVESVFENCAISSAHSTSLPWKLPTLKNLPTFIINAEGGALLARQSTS